MVLDFYPNGKLGRQPCIGSYPSPIVDECYLTIKLENQKINFSYRISALELSTSIWKENIALCKINSISLNLIYPCMYYNSVIGCNLRGTVVCAHSCLIKYCSEEKDFATAEDLDNQAATPVDFLWQICWKYALEAIIEMIIFHYVHNI